MRFPVTREKLRNCSRLVEELSAKEREGEAYDALLEAAVSACRAVTWVLQREITINTPELLPWYEATAREMELPQNSAVIWLRDARNFSTKQEPLKVNSSAHYRDIRIMDPPPGAAFSITSQGDSVWITKDAQGNESRRAASELQMDAATVHRIVRPQLPGPLLLEGRDLSGLDATTFLREYGGFLARLVAAAENAKA